MDWKEQLAETMGRFFDGLKSGRIKQERTGKHKRGRRPRTDDRARLVASRKRERQARKFARLCADGRKHRA